MITLGTPYQVDAITWAQPLTTDRTGTVTIRVYRSGVLVGTTETTTGAATIMVTVPGESDPYFEFLDTDCRRKPAHPGNFTLHWRGSTGAATYRIEENVASVWTERATIRETGEGAYTWVTRWLEDATTHQFRVVAVGSDENETVAVTLSALMVRRPDRPLVTVSKTTAALTLDIVAA